MSNLDLWNEVECTNPDHTKKVTFGRAITAIDPYHQIKNATQQFGPAGKGWGWSVVDTKFLPTNEVACLVRVWHGDDTKYIEQWGQNGLFIDKAEKKKDTDCMKKATTDGITKCLSMLGFNADIFLGKFEDNKYVLKMQEKFNQPELMSKDNLLKIRSMFNEITTEGSFCGDWKLNNLEELHAASFDNAVAYIKGQG